MTTQNGKRTVRKFLSHMGDKMSVVLSVAGLGSGMVSGLFVIVASLLHDEEFNIYIAVLGFAGVFLLFSSLLVAWHRSGPKQNNNRTGRTKTHNLWSRFLAIQWPLHSFVYASIALVVVAIDAGLFAAMVVFLAVLFFQSWKEMPPEKWEFDTDFAHWSDWLILIITAAGHLVLYILIAIAISTHGIWLGVTIFVDLLILSRKLSAFSLLWNAMLAAVRGNINQENELAMKVAKAGAQVFSEDASGLPKDDEPFAGDEDTAEIFFPGSSSWKADPTVSTEPLPVPEIESPFALIIVNGNKLPPAAVAKLNQSGLTLGQLIDKSERSKLAIIRAFTAARQDGTTEWNFSEKLFGEFIAAVTALLKGPDPDDLMLISGMTEPAIVYLEAADIKTYAALATASVDTLAALTENTGAEFVLTWPSQAEYFVKGNLIGLMTYQQTLRSMPAAPAVPDNSQSDDLKLVAGIGEKMESRLKSVGVCTYNQLANASDKVLGKAFQGVRPQPSYAKLRDAASNKLKKSQ